MPRFSIVAGVASLVALWRALPAQAATAAQHAPAHDLPAAVLSSTEAPFVGVVSCFLDSAGLTLESVHLAPATVARRAGAVLANVRLESPATAVGVCINSDGHVVGLRFVTAHGSPRCGYWDPATEVVVDPGEGARLSAVAMLRPGANAMGGLVSADALQLHFTSSDAKSKRARTSPRASKHHRYEKNAQ